MSPSPPPTAAVARALVDAAAPSPVRGAAAACAEALSAGGASGERRDLGRRLVLRRLAAAGAGLGASFAAAVHALPTRPRPSGRSDRLRLASLRVDGREADIGRALAAWAAEARLRTSLEVAREPLALDLRSDSIFQAPLLIWAPSSAPSRPPEAEVGRLREHLGAGGLLFVDDASLSGPSAEVDAAVRALALRLFGRGVTEVPAQDVIFRSFYRLAAAVGRRADQRALQGVRLGDRWALLYGRDDLVGAFRRAPTGGAALPAVPGGEPQREQAYRLGVNLLVYATCLDYKDDHVHVEALLRSRRGRSSGRGGRGD